MSIMILLLNAFLFLRTLPSTAAAPVALPANATSDEEYVAWQSQPNVRGTWDILLNCVVTMSLCIWTALHLNLPVSEDYKEARWVVRLWQNCIIRQVRWVIMGLFAPELVVYMAWTQRKRVYEMNRLVRFAYEGYLVKYAHDGKDLVKWSTAHSWYLLMGGFYFETQGNNTKDFIPGNPKLTITPAALRFMAATKPPLLPEIDEEVILDYSKADRVTKLLVLIQACYMAVQSISRVVKHLPISQLEINTIGHVICAFAIFFFWFDKPKDVRIRTPIRAAWARPLCAYMWICEPGNDEILKLFPIFKPSMDNRRNSSGEEFRKEGTERSLAPSTPDTDPNLIGNSCKNGGLPTTRPPVEYVGKNADAFWSSWQEFDPRIDPTPYSTLVIPVLWKNFRALDWYPQDDITLERFNLALQYFRFWSQRAHSYYRRSNISSDSYETDKTEIRGYDLPPSTNVNVFTKYAKNWTSREDSSIDQANSFVVIAVLTASYGGLHTVAWVAHFPTVIECILWRISTLVIGISGFLFGAERAYICWSVPLHWKIKIRRYHGDHRAALANKSRTWYDKLLEGIQLVDWMLEDAFLGKPADSRMLGGMGATHLVRFCARTMVAIFTLARLYIVSEAFLSLRSMPPAMYETPSWTNWVPHL